MLIRRIHIEPDSFRTVPLNVVWLEQCRARPSVLSTANARSTGILSPIVNIRVKLRVLRAAQAHSSSGNKPYLLDSGPDISEKIGGWNSRLANMQLSDGVFVEL